jgi:hypothetical protein
MACDKRLTTCNDESGQQTKKCKAGMDATTNHQQESCEGQQQPNNESKRTAAGNQQLKGGWRLVT